MSVTGIALILFLTFHACMNLVVLFDTESYDMVCEALGANWYAVAATLGLTVLVALHFIYAIILTLQNRKARGANRYEVSARPDKVEWSSQNMFVLGLIVVLGMVLHLYHFWANMMLAELVQGGHASVVLGDKCYGATEGAGIIAYTFSNPVVSVVYLVWFAAIWFHLTHGFWSALQTLGWNGKIWFCRWKAIGTAYVTVVMLIFVAVVLYFTVCGLCCSSATGCPLQ